MERERTRETEEGGGGWAVYGGPTTPRPIRKRKKVRGSSETRGRHEKLSLRTPDGKMRDEGAGGESKD